MGTGWGSGDEGARIGGRCSGRVGAMRRGLESRGCKQRELLGMALEIIVGTAPTLEDKSSLVLQTHILRSKRSGSCNDQHSAASRWRAPVHTVHHLVQLLRV